jgi:hypothetical protein
MHHFGRGIVPSVSNFGRTGVPPTHPELLDWLATDFVSNGWKLKSLHRKILTSNAWRQTSQVSAESLKIDPENFLYSRMPLQRMDADSLYDSMLKVSGRLDATLFGKPASIEIKPDGEVVPKGSDSGWRRAVYVMQRRRSPVTILEAFDTPPMLPNCVERPKSNVPTQALQLMNSKAVLDHARYLSGRLIDANGNEPQKLVDAAYRNVLSRPASPEEVKAGVTALIDLRQQRIDHLTDKNEATPRASTADWLALGDLVHALLNSAEFIYVD